MTDKLGTDFLSFKSKFDMQVVVVFRIKITLLKNIFQISAYVTYGYGCVIMERSLRRDENITQEEKKYS